MHLFRKRVEYASTARGQHGGVVARIEPILWLQNVDGASKLQSHDLHLFPLLFLDAKRRNGLLECTTDFDIRQHFHQ